MGAPWDPMGAPWAPALVHSWCPIKTYRKIATVPLFQPLAFAKVLKKRKIVEAGKESS